MPDEERQRMTHQLVAGGMAAEAAVFGILAGVLYRQKRAKLARCERTICRLSGSEQSKLGSRVPVSARAPSVSGNRCRMLPILPVSSTFAIVWESVVQVAL